MSYYMRGDYYPPGHSVGDPFFGFLGGLLKKGVGLLGKFGGLPSLGGGKTTAIVKTASEAAGRMIAKHPVLTAAGAAGALGAAGMGAVEHMMGSGAACQKGFHPCKSKHGCRHGACVRNRHMRVTNPRALRRALRRAYGFEKLAMRTIHLLHPRKRARFGGFKKRKRA